MSTFLIKVPGQLPEVRWDETNQSTNANKANPNPRQSMQQSHFPSSLSDLACLTFLLSFSYHMPVALSLLAMGGLLPTIIHSAFIEGLAEAGYLPCLKVHVCLQTSATDQRGWEQRPKEDWGGRTATCGGERKWGTELRRWKTRRWREENEGVVENLGLLGGM